MVSRKWQFSGQHYTVCRSQDINWGSSVGKKHWACSVTPIDQLVHFLMGTSQEEEPQRTFLCSACCAEKNPSFAFLSACFYTAVLSERMRLFKRTPEFLLMLTLAMCIISSNRCVFCVFVRPSVCGQKVQTALYKVSKTLAEMLLRRSYLLKECTQPKISPPVLHPADVTSLRKHCGTNSTVTSAEWRSGIWFVSLVQSHPEQQQCDVNAFTVARPCYY